MGKATLKYDNPPDKLIEAIEAGMPVKPYGGHAGHE